MQVGVHTGEELPYFKEQFGACSTGETRFFLFEPNPELHVSLAHKVRRLGFPNNTVLSTSALSNTTTNMTLVVPKHRRRKVREQLQQTAFLQTQGPTMPLGPNFARFTVPVMTLDGFMEQQPGVGSISLLMIDTEGMVVVLSRNYLIPVTVR